MSPASSLNHQWVAANIIGELRNALKEKVCSACRVYDFIDLKISEMTVVQPDCSVVCGTVSGNFLSTPPNLVVEVLSLKTAMKDRHTKFGIYEQFGIKYYMLVEPDEKEVEIYQLKDSKYTLMDSSFQNVFSFALTDDYRIGIDLKNFWE